MSIFSSLMRGMEESDRSESIGESIRADQSRMERDQYLLQNKVVELEVQNAQLALLFRVLYDLCLAKDVFSKAEFKEAFDRIDLEDGRKDGMLKRP